MTTARLPDGFFAAVPGIFLQWAVEDAARAHPGATVSVVSPSRGTIAGFVPLVPSGQRITLVADDVKVKLA
jgi:hypothetical protein